MESTDVNLKSIPSIDLSQAKHQLVTVPLIWLAVIFVAGWVGKPWLADAVGFVTVAQAEQQAKAVKELGDKFDDHITEFRAGLAFQMMRGLSRDLAEHNNNPHDTLAWREKQRRLETKVRLATEYKTCVVSESENCHILKEQLYK